MGSEEFSITWNDHPRTVMGILGKYLDEGTLVDCSIAAEGKVLKAHSLVLSACSSYFELLFCRELKEENVVVLEDVKFKDLILLVGFMYDGEVTIPKEGLQDFVRAAESLQIRGLRCDLVLNSLREETEMSVECTEEGLASQLSHKHIRCCAISGGCSDLQSPSSVGKKLNGDSEPQSTLKDDSNRKTVLPAEKEPSVKPMTEVDVEDTAIWESEVKEESAVTDLFTSASAGEEIRVEFSPILGTISSCISCANSSHTLQKESSKPVGKTEAIPAVVSLHNERTGDPMHSVFVEEVRSWEGDEAIAADTCHHETTNQNLEVAAAVSHIQSAELLNSPDNGFASSCVVAQKDNEEVSVKAVQNEDAETDKECVTQESKSIDVNDSTVDKVVETGQQSIIKVDKDNVEKGEHEKKGQKMMEMVERAMEADVAVKQSEAEDEDSAPLSKRISKMKGKKSHRCLKCPDVFHTVSDLQLHMKNVHKNQRCIRCEVCKATFACNSQLISHKRGHGGKVPYWCAVCEKFVGHKTDFYRHMRTHTGERPFQCDICKKAFTSKSYLTKHKRMHTGEHSFHCDVCKVSFSEKSDLNVHKRIHTDVPVGPYQCDICKRSFKHKNNLGRHMTSHSGARPFQCDACPMTYSQRGNLNRHYRIHTGLYPFQCDVCKRFFALKSNLIAHIVTHTGERCFQCKFCEKAFTSRSYLTVHERTHAGDRPFQCDICKVAFSEKSDLNVHKLIHSGEPRYQCDVCKKFFKDKKNLSRHAYVHSGVRPFRCDVCTMSFKRKVNLNRHKNTHSDERPFHCGVCKRAFYVKTIFETHMRTHTG